MAGTYAGRPCAVKELFTVRFNDNEVDEAFMAEAALLARLRHPNILGFFGVSGMDDIGERVFMVMEPVEQVEAHTDNQHESTLTASSVRMGVQSIT